MTGQVQAGSPRERLMEAASEQFYALGYRAVGIDQIIRESAIAKATFYSHFESKEALYVEVLKKRSDDEIASMRNFIESRSDPLDRVLAPVDFMFRWLPERDFRGCAFINMTAEIYDFACPARKVGIEHYAKIRALIAGCARELAESDPGKYPHLAKESFVRHYMAIFAGAIALSSMHRDESAIHSARELIIRTIRCAC